MKNHFKFLQSLPALVTITAMLLTTACSAPQKDTTPAFDMTAARTAIDETNRNFMDFMSKGDSVGVANSYTADAKFMIPNAPAAVGRSNIQTVIAGFINSGATKLTTKTVDVWGDAATLTEEGEYTLATAAGQTLDQGKYLILWKMDDGKWKMHRDIINSNLPVPAAN